MKIKRGADDARFKLNLRSGKFWFCVVELLCIVAIMVVFAWQTSGWSSKYNENLAEIATLEGDIYEYTNKKVITVAEGEKIISSAKKHGDAVAKWQNAYAKADEHGGVQAISDNLSAYFTNGDTDGKSVWYSTQYVNGANWVFSTPYQFTASSIKALWQCRDADGKLLMYVTATYNVAAGKFFDVTKQTTAYGEEVLYKTTSDAVLKQGSSDTYAGQTEKPADTDTAKSETGSDAASGMTDDERRQILDQGNHDTYGQHLNDERGGNE